MRKNFRPILSVIVILCLFAAGCGKNRVENRQDIFNSGATGQFGSMYIVYDEELKTGGNLYVYTGGENQFVNLSCCDKPFGGEKCIEYSWNGGNVYDYNTGAYQWTFAGLSLSVTQGSAGISTAVPRDLTQAGYTTLVFYIRGALSENVTVKVEGPDDADSSTPAPGLTINSMPSQWTRYSFAVTPSSLSNIREFFKITFVYTNPQGTLASGKGGVVYLDNIYYEK